MRRISRVVIGAAVSAALLGGIGGAALATAATGTLAATAIEYGPVHNVLTCNPTAVEYATPTPGCS
jgi:hypothetical protein